MSEKLKRNFDTLDEAVAAWTPETLAHSMRVGSYMRVLFLQACACGAGADVISGLKVKTRLEEEYSDMAYGIGFYHDIGKATLPAEYQNMNEEFSPEEVALYQRHVSDSARLMGAMLEQDPRFKPQDVIYVNEAIAFHHERWNGTGFPDRLAGLNIPFLAQMLGMADTLDHLCCETHSETPFEESIAKLLEEEDKAFSPEIVSLVKPAVKKLKRVFHQYIKQTRYIPKIRPFVKRIANRPISLWYRPVEDRATGFTIAAEAAPRIVHGKESFAYDEVGFLFKHDQQLRRDLGIYIALEACDTVRRLDVSGVPMEFLAVHFPTGWFKLRGAAKEILTAAADSGIAPSRICPVLDRNEFSGKNAILKENVWKLRDAGCSVIFSDLTLATEAQAQENLLVSVNDEGETVTEKKDDTVVTVDEILALGLTMYRIGATDKEQFESEAFVSGMKTLVNNGVTLIADALEEDEQKLLLDYWKVTLTTGALTGPYLAEDDFVKTEIAEFDARK